VTIPPGTPPGTVLRLQEKVCRNLQQHYGELYLRIEVHIPEKTVH